MKTLLSLLLLAALTPLFADLQIDKINQAIQKNNAAWTAGDNWVTALSADERARLCGTILEPPADAQDRLINLAPVENMPSALDWRNNDGNWVTPVRNQASCGSCWDFSATAQVEAWWLIQNSMPDVDLDLSEQFVLSCGDAGSCSGGQVYLALSFFQEVGVPPEPCLPYEASDFVSCDEACDNWEKSVVTIPGWGFITLEEAIVENIKRALTYHPVSASYTVYDDFFSYSGGVYEHVWGEVSGGHAILIVGWDDDEQSWICKNSWGSNWGEDGYFRIKWGDSGMGQNMPFIYDNVTNNALQLSPKALEVELTVGDSTTEYIQVKNNSANPLQFSLIDYEVPIAFHPDAFNSFDGSSWWCGDPEIGGYNNHWLQYLDTPVMDLSSATNPQLTFQTFWAIEPPGGTDPPWDGWDGANVWMSGDSGKTFSVINPIEPAYTCKSLWAFGEKDQGWDMGPGIPGWAGNSNGWISAAFDLTPYKTENVVIRFAFASDLAFCSEDDETVIGFFVDEIKIADDTTALFFDDADNFNNMNAQGFGINVASWMDIDNPAAKLGPGESHQAALSISAKNLHAGKYEGLISVSSNDSSAQADVPVYLRVKETMNDLELVNIQPADRQPIFSAVTPVTLIRNNGNNVARSFTITCSMVLADTAFVETVAIDSLAPGASMNVSFTPYMAVDSSTVQLDFSINNNPNDQIAFNDTSSATISISNIVDDFETDLSYRKASGGWARTDRYAGYNDSQFSMHPHGGEKYLPNMDAVLSYTLPIHVTSLDTDSVDVVLSYWAWAITEEDVDNCYLEISGDSTTWTSVDTLTGSFRMFEQINVPILSNLETQAEKFWFRFRFVSNESEEFFGVYLDDITVSVEKRESEDDDEGSAVQRDAQPPLSWQLQQNYPNPFNPSTTIRYSVKTPAHVTIDVYNTVGRQVAVLVDEKQRSGAHSITWHPQDLASGVYMYKINAKTETGEMFQALKKMLLIK